MMDALTYVRVETLTTKGTIPIAIGSTKITKEFCI
jgi:hypothetical protein